MYIQSVIETNEQSLEEFDAFKKRKDSTTILNSLSKLCSWPAHSDLLSLKFAFRGTEYYCINRNKIPISNNKFLVVNADQLYSSFIRSSDWVNSFAVYLDETFFNQVVTAYATPDEVLLDNPGYRHSQSIWFFEQVYTITPALNRYVRTFKTELETSSLNPVRQEEYLHQILAALLTTYQTKLTQTAGALSSVKASTRLELYRRLHLAKAFIDDQADTDVQLVDIAHTAMLSKNHLLRHFKSLFGCSPYQHLVNRRMELAKDKLLQSDLPVHLIAIEHGFDCPSAFGRRFKAQFSLTPSAYRQRFLE